MPEAFEASEAERGGLVEVRFTLAVSGETVPGRLWLPGGASGPVPLVLIQHPGMSSKDDPIVAEPARAWAAAHGWACLGLDAPGHGERATADPLSALRDPEAAGALATQFAAEVSAVLDEITARYPLATTGLGYYGYSLGAMLGVPAVASDGRFRAAVFAAVGTGALSGPAEGAGSHLAALGDVAVRVIAKAQDELISGEATAALFAGLPGEKDLVTLPGGHFAVGPEVAGAAEEWLAAHL